MNGQALVLLLVLAVSCSWALRPTEGLSSLDKFTKLGSVSIDSEPPVYQENLADGCGDYYYALMTRSNLFAVSVSTQTVLWNATLPTNYIPFYIRAHGPFAIVYTGGNSIKSLIFSAKTGKYIVATPDFTVPRNSNPYFDGDHTLYFFRVDTSCIAALDLETGVAKCLLNHSSTEGVYGAFFLREEPQALIVTNTFHVTKYYVRSTTSISQVWRVHANAYHGQDEKHLFFENVTVTSLNKHLLVLDKKTFKEVYRLYQKNYNGYPDIGLPDTKNDIAAQREVEVQPVVEDGKLTFLYQTTDTPSNKTNTHMVTIDISNNAVVKNLFFCNTGAPPIPAPVVAILQKNERSTNSNNLLTVWGNTNYNVVTYPGGEVKVNYTNYASFNGGAQPLGNTGLGLAINVDQFNIFNISTGLTEFYYKTPNNLQGVHLYPYQPYINAKERYFVVMNGNKAEIFSY